MRAGILCVEDDTDDIAVLSECFQIENYKAVSFCNDALAAIAYLASLPGDALPRMIITDYNLPKMSGYDFVSFIKNDSRYADIELVVLSTHISAIDQDKFLKAGVKILLLKPYNYDEFTKMVHELVQRAAG